MSPAIVSVVEAGRRAFRVMIGPFTTVAEADAAVEQAIRGGAPDARIVIE
jgi:SPOR domain